MRWTLPWLVFALCAAVAWSAEISYDPEPNCIRVSGFPEDAPGTLDDVLKADQEHGWNRATYDAATDTYRATASLWIGNREDSGTFFRIGSTNHPRATLVLHGDLWVRPPKESAVRTSDRRYAVANMLTVGDPRNPDIRPAIKVACSTPQEFGVFVGVKGRPGGSLRLYNATITAATPDKDHVLRGFAYRNAKTGYIGGWWAHELQLVNSTISWVGDTIGLSAPTMRYNDWEHHNFVANDMTFEHCGAVRFWPAYVSQYRIGDELPTTMPTFVVRNSDFRNMKAVSCYTSSTFVGCRFEGLRETMAFRTMPTGAHIVYVDCTLCDSAEPWRLQKAAPAKPGKTRRPDPRVDELVTVVCRVVDRPGRPVPRALVSVRCKQDDSAVHRGMAVTGEDGSTPERLEKGAIVLTIKRSLPGKAPETPLVSRFGYSVNVRAAGYAPLDVDLSEEQVEALPRPLGIVLRKK